MKKWIVVLLAAATLVRVGYVLNIKISPLNDMRVFEKAALSVMKNGLGSGYHYACQPPVYPLLLASFFSLFGHSYLVPRLFQALTGSGICLLLFLIGKRLFGARVAFIILFLSAFYPDFISYSGVLLAETPSIFLFLLLIYLLLEKKSPFLCGVFYGVAILTKALYLVFVPGLIFWFLKDGRRGFLKLAKFIFPAFLIVFSWMWRNYACNGKFFITNHMWVDVYIGQNPTSLRAALGRAGKWGIYLFTREKYGKFYLDDSLTTLEKNKVARKKVFEFMVSKPLRQIPLAFAKFLRFWTMRTRFDFYSFNFPFRKYMFFLALLFNFFAIPLGALGFFFAPASEGVYKIKVLLLNYVAVFITIFAAFGRMSFHAMPFTLLFAGFGLSSLPDYVSGLRSGSIRITERRNLLFLLFVFLTMMFFVWQVFDRFHKVIEIL